ncbi:hypothetical protein G4Y79_22465 [Phototrophicus methaneseepsis]|uniref:Uncharacterized protein n=1 Tax=Phototrophicus methaneseepsis TaxID=2710758 RepID=A0A7S8E8N8_9CHLR|nr:hypothetical protein [Phototrophicus methaneseepsis]QPC82416.1 hypothetical protein G4Y79_22465 [Phototrophicus methaneseepsis]
MTTVSKPLGVAQTEPRAQATTPSRSLAFDYQMMILGTVMLFGVFLDGWAHNHGRVDDSFFTPWHAVLYGGYALAGGRLVLAQFVNVGRGYKWLRALPPGYILSLLGVIIFGGAGIVDMIWHETFGFEENLEALLSPSHLLLMTGALLIMTGPLRAAWLDATPYRQRGWRFLLPAIMSVTSVFALLSFFLAYAYFTEDLTYLVGIRPGGSRGIVDAMGIMGLLVPPMLLTACILFLRRRWRLPFGTVTLMLCLTVLLMTWLSLDATYEFLLAVPMLMAGLVGDVLLWRYNSPQRLAWLRLMAFGAPFAIILLYLITIQQFSGQFLWWEIHMWLGAPVLAGVLGYLLSFVAYPPAMPPNAATD